jgi:hypothetical protein
VAEPLRFIFQLLNRTSQPADEAAKSVDNFKKALAGAKKESTSVDAAMLKTAIAEAKVATETKRLTRELDSYTKQLQPMKRITAEWGNMYKSIAGFRRKADGRWIFNVADGLSSVLSVAERLAGAFYSVAENAIKVGAQSDKTGRAIKANLGGKAGEDAIQYIRRVSEASGGQYTQDQLRNLLLPAIQQGYATKDLQRLLGAGLDVKQRGLDAGGAIGALTAVRTSQSISGGTLDALGFGSRADKVRIAKRLGAPLASRNPEEALGYLQQQVAISPAKAQRVYDVLLDELAKRNPSGKLGESAAFAQESPTATLERLANLPQLLGEKLSADGALKSLYEALDRFTEFMQGPEGTKAMLFLRDAMIEFVGASEKFVRGLSWIHENDEKYDKLKNQGGFAGVVAHVPFLRGLLSDPDSPRPEYKPTAFKMRGESFSNPSSGLPPEVKLAEGSSAERRGFDEEKGAIAARKAEAAGPILPKGSADDFIWRNGRAIEIDPQDNVIGFKRGGSLGAGEGGGGGGGGLSVTLQFGDVMVNGHGKSTPEMAQDFLREVELQAPASLLLSALEQFVAEAGG